MAASSQAEFQDKLSDITECSICAEIFTKPKILPCVHTFCLHCLEKYGKDKKPGDLMACPICRNEFVIPGDGFCNLPNNFFIGKMVEIGKLTLTPAKKPFCALCPEEEKVFAEMFCVDCEHNLCNRCSKTHKKTKHCQTHQVVELGRKRNAQELTMRNSYCERHPKELIKLYCHEDNVAICVLCHVESHQSHRCVNIEKPAGEFTEQLKDDLRKVSSRLPECEEALNKLNEYKTEFKEEVLKTEESIRDAETKLKELVDQHAQTLIQNLKLVTEKNTKAMENTKQDVKRFRAMIDSYNRFSEELLKKGSPVDICRAACQMHLRANQLEKLPVNCSGDDFYCDTVALRPSNVEDLLRKHGSNNAVGELTITPSSDRLLVFQREISATLEPFEKQQEQRKSRISETVTNLKPYQLSLIETEQFRKKLKQKFPNVDFEMKTTGVHMCGMPDAVKKAKLFLYEKVTTAAQDSFEISETMGKVFAKDEARPYLKEQLLSKGISASWTCNNKRVVVFALKDQHLKKAVEILKNEVAEVPFHLNSQHEEFVQLRSWKDFIRRLCEEDKLLEIGVYRSLIVVACMRSSIHQITERIEGFFAKSRLPLTKYP